MFFICSLFHCSIFTHDPFLLCNFLGLIIVIRKCVCKPMKTGHQLKQDCEIVFKADGEVTVMQTDLKITLGI